MQLHQAAPDDAEAIAAIRAEMLEAHPEGAWYDRLVQHLRIALSHSTDTVAYLITGDNNQIIAGALATLHQALPGPDYTGLSAYIHLVYTDPAHRRQGHARAVTAALLEHLNDAGCSLVTLNSSYDALSLYASLGFQDNKSSMSLFLQGPRAAPAPQLA